MNIFCIKFWAKHNKLVSFDAKFHSIKEGVELSWLYSLLKKGTSPAVNIAPFTCILKIESLFYIAVCMHEQSTNHTPRKRQVGRCYAEVPTGQDTFQPTPSLISYTEPVLAIHDSFCFIVCTLPQH